MKKVLLSLVFALMGLSIPSIGFAAHIHYTATGFIADIHGDILPITGGMYVENQVRMGGEPVEVGDIPYGEHPCWVTISSFSFDVGGNSFFGDGQFYMHISRPFLGSDYVLVDTTEWFLYGEQGSDWSRWTNHIWAGNPLHTQNGFFLPDEIDLKFLDGWDSGCPILGDPFYHPPFELMLVRSGHNYPVPEPLTVILLGSGLIIGVSYRKWQTRFGIGG